MEYPTLITSDGPVVHAGAGARPGDRDGARARAPVVLRPRRDERGRVAVSRRGHQPVRRDRRDGAVAGAPAPPPSLWGLEVGDGAIQAVASNRAVQDEPVAQAGELRSRAAQTTAASSTRARPPFSTPSRACTAMTPSAARSAQYARRFRFQHPGPEQLLGVFEETMGPQVAATLRAALFDKGWVDYAVDDVRERLGPRPASRNSVVPRRRGARRSKTDRRRASAGTAAGESKVIPWSGTAPLRVGGRRPRPARDNRREPREQLRRGVREGRGAPRTLGARPSTGCSSPCRRCLRDGRGVRRPDVVGPCALATAGRPRRLGVGDRALARRELAGGRSRARGLRSPSRGGRSPVGSGSRFRCSGCSRGKPTACAPRRRRRAFVLLLVRRRGARAAGGPDDLDLQRPRPRAARSGARGPSRRRCARSGLSHFCSPWWASLARGSSSAIGVLVGEGAAVLDSRIPRRGSRATARRRRRGASRSARGSSRSACCTTSRARPSSASRSAR